MLGPRPLNAGWGKWLCKPTPGDLSWAAGQVPTPFGPIQVKWVRKPSSGVVGAVFVHVPAGSTCIVGLPTAMLGTKILVNSVETSPEISLSDDSDLDASECGYITLKIGRAHV